MNQVTLIGRLTKKADVGYAHNSDMAIAKFTLAVDRMKKGEADFIRVTAFGKTAEIVDRYTDKGRQLAVQGRLQTGSYEKDGKKVFTMDVIADRVELIGSASAPATREEADSIPKAPDDWKVEDAFAQADDDIPF